MESINSSLLKTWKHGDWTIRVLLLFAFVVIAIAVFSLFRQNDVDRTIATVLIGLVFLSWSAAWAVRGDLLEQEAREQKVEAIEQRLREHPEKPQLAWDLARVKLENYLDRNLGQVRSIYWLTLIVMLCGFGFVSYGLFRLHRTLTSFQSQWLPQHRA